MARKSTSALAFTSMLLQLCLLTSASPAPKQYPELTIFARQTADACGAGSSRCSDPNISNFCCPTNTECIAVLNNTAVGCCPTGQDCRVLTPSDCGSTGTPTTQLTKCTNGKCCPPGYLCDGDFCQLQYESWPQKTDGPDPASPTETTFPSTNSTTLSESQREAGFISKSECPAVTAGGFAAGFVPGLVIGGSLAFLILYVRARKKEKMTRKWSRMPSSSHRSRKGSKSSGSNDAEKSSSHSKPSKHKVTIGYQPEVIVTAPPPTFDGLGVSNGIAGRNYAVSNTSTQMFAQYDDPEPARRGRLRVHGETPPLPSVTLPEITGSNTDVSSSQQSSESLSQNTSITETPAKRSSSKKHKRKESNPSFRDLTSVSKFRFKNLLSNENLKEQRGSLASETSVGSSIHSSVFTQSERQSRGNRYPVAVPGMPSKYSRSKASTRGDSESPKNELGLRRADTTATEHTNFEEDGYSPLTASNSRAFTDSSVPLPSAVSSSSNLNIPPHARNLHENYLNVPEGINNSRISVATATSEMTEVDGYRSPFHDRFQYRSYTSEGSYEDDVDDDGRSIAANSAYPASFLDIHFENTSPTSPMSADSSRGNSDIPAIPPLFQHKNRPLDESSPSNSSSISHAQGPRKYHLRGGSGLDRESVDITVVIDDGHAPNQRWRANNNVNSGTSNGAIGIGGAMTGGRYTMQTMEINKF
ncbi:hypothetical protein TWF696_002696 [Orbilia brochopaga]|uniref:Uncharacterized protein n=1 Tax=Orbilia brochopaga TaxID=3140254 RepID=A0AAV9U6L7_9PEZI